MISRFTCGVKERVQLRDAAPQRLRVGVSQGGEPRGTIGRAAALQEDQRVAAVKAWRRASENREEPEDGTEENARSQSGKKSEFPTDGQSVFCSKREDVTSLQQQNLLQGSSLHTHASG